MQTEYVTERRTVVTAKPIGRPRKPETLAAPITPPKPRFEIIGDGENVLVDGLLPRRLALLIRAMIDPA